MNLVGCTFTVSCLNEKHKTAGIRQRFQNSSFVDFSGNTLSIHLFKMLSLNKLLEHLGRGSKNSVIIIYA